MAQKSRLHNLLNLLKGKYFNSLNSKPIEYLEKLAKLPENQLLPDIVAQNLNEEMVEKKLVINFEFFSIRVCKLQVADEIKLKSCLETLKQVAGYTAKSIVGCGLIRGYVYRRNNGHYDELFNGLEDDIEKIAEIDIAGNGRIYGFIADNDFFIVAIDTLHRET